MYYPCELPLYLRSPGVSISENDRVSRKQLLPIKIIPAIFQQG